MKIKCNCGALILDQTDDLPHKAHVIGDIDYFNYLNTIDAAIESTDANKDGLCMKVRRANPSRLAWECAACGRLYFDDKAGRLVAYVPENNKANHIFDRPGPDHED